MRFAAVVYTEFLKLRRSKAPWITLAVYTFMVGIAGFFMWLMKNPGLAESLGIFGKKAQFAFGGEPIDWATFLGFIVQMGGIGGLIMSSVIVTYVFGREYAEGTAKNLLALPVARRDFVFAKILVSAAWFGCLTLYMLPGTFIVGSLVGIGTLEASLFSAAAGRLLALALMSLCCSFLTAWVAVGTRGYFAPLGYSIFTLLLAMIFAATGWGPWVPWSIVGIYSGTAGPEASLGWGSFFVIAATAAAGILLTLSHEIRADNLQ